MPEWLADDPPADDGAPFEAEECALAGLSPPPPALAAGGAPAGAGAGAGDADLGATGTAMEDRVSTESVAMGDRPA